MWCAERHPQVPEADYGRLGQLSSVFAGPGTGSPNGQDLLQPEFPAIVGRTTRIVFAARPGLPGRPGGRTGDRCQPGRRGQGSGVIEVRDPFRAGALSVCRRIGYAEVLFREPCADVPQPARDWSPRWARLVRRAAVLPLAGLHSRRRPRSKAQGTSPVSSSPSRCRRSCPAPLPLPGCPVDVAGRSCARTPNRRGTLSPRRGHA